jgi:hypothetical protein
MMTEVLGILGMAALFVVFGLGAWLRRCSGDCGHCQGACSFAESLDEDA